MLSGQASGRAPDLHLALVHSPVVDKNGDTIASAVTNLDLHDIARAARTYGVRSFFVVTPLDDQKTLVQRIVSHWLEGYGARYNPKRGEALRLIRIADTIADAIAAIRAGSGGIPRTVATSARSQGRAIGYGRCRQMIGDGRPVLLIFGTAWGLDETLIEETDFVLEPVSGNQTYNHLSVRSAAAIILDRLMGRA